LSGLTTSQDEDDYVDQSLKATGAVIWKFDDPDKNKKWNKRTWFNFYNPQFVPDQNGDGVEDILISNGGT